MAGTGDLLPLLIFFVIIGIAGFVGYHIYLVVSEIGDKSRKTMEKKNISFTKGGARVGVKSIDDEKYAAKTQSVLVNAWNSASIPNYKSRLGWNSSQARPEPHRSKSAHSPSPSRPSPGSRTPSSSSHKSSNPTGNSSSAHLSAPRPAPARQMSNPGAWPAS